MTNESFNQPTQPTTPSKSSQPKASKRHTVNDVNSTDPRAMEQLLNTLDENGYPVKWIIPLTDLDGVTAGFRVITDNAK